VSQGMSETLLDDLAATIGEFEQTLEATRAGRREHVGASADLVAVGRRDREQVAVAGRAGAVSVRGECRADGAWASAGTVRARSRRRRWRRPQRRHEWVGRFYLRLRKGP